MRPKKKRKVYVSGPCNKYGWYFEVDRLFGSHEGITAHMHAVDYWNEDALRRETQQISSCTHFMTVITPYTRGLYSVAQAIYNVCNRQKNSVILIVERVGDVSFSKEDLDHLESVLDLARYHKGRIFYNIIDAVACITWDEKPVEMP